MSMTELTPIESQSTTWLGRVAKAAFTLVRFCLNLAPVLAIYVDGGGRCPEKENGPTPLGRLSSFHQPGRAKLKFVEQIEDHVEVEIRPFGGPQ